jgi:mono/diheme cytochrome c family protein
MSRQTVRNVLAWAIAGLAAVGTCRAQGVADRGAGQSLAREWCAECHDIRPGRMASRNPSAPPFAELVNNPAVTETALRALLTRPHESMPNIRFTAEQMDAIVDYLLSLKSPQ